jgi:hypothetical protein
MQKRTGKQRGANQSSGILTGKRKKGGAPATEQRKADSAARSNGKGNKRKRVPGLVHLSNDALRRMAKKNQPPQSWYDEDMEGLY